MKRLLLLLFIIAPLYSQDFNKNHIPIQEDGRIKPLDSFARNQLLKIYGKTKLTIQDSTQTYKISATNWLLSVLAHDPNSKTQSIFRIDNPDVVKTLGLQTKEKLLYSFNEIDTQIKYNQNLINYIIERKSQKKDLTLIETQIFDLWLKKELFKNLQIESQALIPSIQIKNNKIASEIECQINDRISLMTMHLFLMSDNGKKIIQSIKNIGMIIQMQNTENHQLESLGYKDWTQEEYSEIIKYYQDYESGIIKYYEDYLQQIKPSHFNENVLSIFPYNSHEQWFSPANLLFASEADVITITENQSQLLIIFEKLLASHIQGLELEPNNLIKYKTMITELDDINFNLLNREVQYNNANLFLWSLIFYIIGLVGLVVLSMSSIKIINNKYFNLNSIPLMMIGVGFLYHLSGIIMRMIILERPPVSTLYESIIFVGLIAVLLSIILEFIKRDNVSLFLGSISGIILHYISFGYASDGDTLGVLIAVLNSNFWLATHVTTITIGYGTTIIASLVGHLYLIKANLNSNHSEQLKKIYNNMVAVTFIALFFTMFGTILGGIWGDQSWGRFWGWDPKENGALLIVMWLLMMVHMRLSGMIRGEGYALGLVLANITVAIAWFGVNLLNVGLHSYGFTSGVAFNLLIFIIFELIFGLLLYFRVKLKY